MQTDGLKQVRELAKAMQTGLFADRETLQEAFDYMYKVASDCKNSVSVLTAVHVVLNTAAKQIEKECNREMWSCVSYNPNPEQMACANRLNAALFPWIKKAA